jgi:hypothetical protein
MKTFNNYILALSLLAFARTCLRGQQWKQWQYNLRPQLFKMTRQVAICTEDLYLVTRKTKDDFHSFYRDESEIDSRKAVHNFPSFHGDEGDKAWADIEEANFKSK